MVNSFSFQALVLWKIDLKTAYKWVNQRTLLMFFLNNR